MGLARRHQANRRSEAMTKRKDLNLEKWGISKRRYRELYNFCLQYQEWRDELKFCQDTLKSPQITGMPMSITNKTGDPTGELATRLVSLQKKCELIEQSCLEADSSIYQWLLKGVTEESATFMWLWQRLNMPCCREYYNTSRRKFFYCLDKNKT